MNKKAPMTTKMVSFSFESPTARKVAVVGDFNGWDNSRTPLRKGKDSIWTRDLKLKSGRYEYKFYVDGNWVPDPKNNSKVGNSFGTENSLLQI